LFFFPYLAAKFRQKNKQAAETLEQQMKELTQKNMNLHSVVKDLKEEALMLKERLLTHMTFVHGTVI
jgi:cell division protein FtsB